MITPANINPLEPPGHSETTSPRRTGVDAWLATLIRRREDRLIRAAFQRADDPGLVLDVSREIGRFWPVLAEKANRRVVAAAASLDEVTRARDQQPARAAARVYPFSTGLAPIDLPDGAVDCVLCTGRWEQGMGAEQRVALLREFRRVARESLIISLQPGRHLDVSRQGKASGRIFPDVAEAEFTGAGFRVRMTRDVLPMVARWRVYVLRKVDGGGE